MSRIDYHQPFYLPANRVWRTYLGGRTLDRIEGEVEPKDSHFLEDWVGSETRAVNPGREELVDEGIGKGLGVGGPFTMEEIYRTDPEKGLGRRATSFPLLISSPCE